MLFNTNLIVKQLQLSKPSSGSAVELYEQLQIVEDQNGIEVREMPGPGEEPSSSLKAPNKGQIFLQHLIFNEKEQIYSP